MFWEDILVDRMLTSDEIKAAISNSFLIAMTEVLVVDDIADTIVTEQVRVLCEQIPTRGDFLMKLSIYLRDPSLERFDHKQVIGKLCNLLDCKCLISDNSDNPYSMLQIEGETSQRNIFLKPELLDEEEYVIDESLLKEKNF